MRGGNRGALRYCPLEITSMLSARRAPALCRAELPAGQNNVIIRNEGTLAPCFPMYALPFDWGNIDNPKFDDNQLRDMKESCQRYCFSTLNHNLAYSTTTLASSGSSGPAREEPVEGRRTQLRRMRARTEQCRHR